MNGWDAEYILHVWGFHETNTSLPWKGDGSPQEGSSFPSWIRDYISPPTGNSRKTRERIKPSITREKEINK
ncbi:hypothetical protein [Saccharolobus islandicus]|uniref:hypothetical protein n=1 Tax=Saccharolobus islandicus TaxID=43080 RepID=UPI0009B5C879|nr:hypothetical protein [Sulfolobus islandicus]